MSDQNEISELKAENTRLISLLEQHRIFFLHFGTTESSQIT